jgi:hypothetical protein
MADQVSGSGRVGPLPWPAKRQTLSKPNPMNVADLLARRHLRSNSSTHAGKAPLQRKSLSMQRIGESVQRDLSFLVSNLSLKSLPPLERAKRCFEQNPDFLEVSINQFPITDISEQEGFVKFLLSKLKSSNASKIAKIISKFSTMGEITLCKFILANFSSPSCTWEDNYLLIPVIFEMPVRPQALEAAKINLNFFPSKPVLFELRWEDRETLASYLISQANDQNSEKINDLIEVMRVDH